MAKKVGSTDRIFDQVSLSKSTFGLAYFVKNSEILLKRYGVYNEKLPIFSKAKNEGVFMAASHIVAELTGDEVVTCRYQLSDTIFLNLTIDEINSTLKGEIDTERSDSLVISLRKYLIDYNLADDHEVSEDHGLKPSDLDLIG